MRRSWMMSLRDRLFKALPEAASFVSLSVCSFGAVSTGLQSVWQWDQWGGAIRGLVVMKMDAESQTETEYRFEDSGD
jgi:hypothetical protein